MPTYFDLEVSLLEIEPRIWRRFLIHSEATFMNLHCAIQDALGWHHRHLFEFRHLDNSNERTKSTTPVRRIARCKQAEVVDDEVVPFAEDLQLVSFFAGKNDRCLYLYDFGDDWRHLVQLRDVVESSDSFTRRLVDGAMACPPEDCGGSFGYEECCEAIGMSKSDIRKLDSHAREGVESRLEWLDGWQPEAFALEEMKRSFDQ